MAGEISMAIQDSINAQARAAGAMAAQPFMTLAEGKQRLALLDRARRQELEDDARARGEKVADIASNQQFIAGESKAAGERRQADYKEMERLRAVYEATQQGLSGITEDSTFKDITEAKAAEINRQQDQYATQVKALHSVHKAAISSIEKALQQNQLDIKKTVAMGLDSDAPEAASINKEALRKVLFDKTASAGLSALQRDKLLKAVDAAGNPAKATKEVLAQMEATAHPFSTSGKTLAADFFNALLAQQEPLFKGRKDINLALLFETQKGLETQWRDAKKATLDHLSTAMQQKGKAGTWAAGALEEIAKEDGIHPNTVNGAVDFLNPNPTNPNPQPEPARTPPPASIPSAPDVPIGQQVVNGVPPVPEGTGLFPGAAQNIARWSGGVGSPGLGIPNFQNDMTPGGSPPTAGSGLTGVGNAFYGTPSVPPIPAPTPGAIQANRAQSFKNMQTNSGGMINLARSKGIPTDQLLVPKESPEWAKVEQLGRKLGMDEARIAQARSAMESGDPNAIATANVMLLMARKGAGQDAPPVGQSGQSSAPVGSADPLP
jgi:hypothetical protein